MHYFCLPRTKAARSVPQTPAGRSQALCLTSAQFLPHSGSHWRGRTGTRPRQAALVPQGPGEAGSGQTAATARPGAVPLPAAPHPSCPPGAARGACRRRGPAVPCLRCGQPAGPITGPWEGPPGASDIRLRRWMRDWRRQRFSLRGAGGGGGGGGRVCCRAPPRPAPRVA